MKSHAVTLAPLLLLFTATACVDGPDLAATSGEIVNGTVDNGHPEVVRISQFDPTYPNGGATEYCTGTLIGGRTVLTAAHCTRGFTGGAYPSVTVEGKLREYDRETRRWFTLPYAMTAQIVRHPSLDVAVLRLPELVTGVTAARVSTTVGAGQPLTLVGFGGVNRTDPAWGQTKRFGFNVVDRTDDTSLYYDGATGADSATCYGDSGGPAFGGGYASSCIVGLARGQVGSIQTACTEDAGEWFHTRADVVAAWVQQQTTDVVNRCTP